MQSKHPLIVDGIGLEVDTLAKPINWSRLFDNTNPVEIEIGMGKGTFLTDQAKTRPEVNFLGIEWASWFWRYASDRLRRNQCTNARTVRAEAHYFFREHVPPRSISAVHIYFPDPWPKKRHHKRRLIQPAFLELLEQALTADGRLQIVTDHEGYFEENIQPSISGSRLKLVEYLRANHAADGEFVGTNFERKYAREGRPFYAIAAVKQSHRD